MTLPESIPGRWIGDRKVELTAPMFFAVGTNGERQHHVPRGFVTDFASTPQRLHVQFLVIAYAAIMWADPSHCDWWVTGAIALCLIIRRLVPPAAGKHAPAAILHDYLYSTGRTTKWEADLLFLTGMKALGVSRFRRNVMFAAVFLFGGWPWAKHRIKESGGWGALRKLLSVW